jgi:hypothetical protein
MFNVVEKEEITVINPNLNPNPNPNPKKRKWAT